MLSSILDTYNNTIETQSYIITDAQKTKIFTQINNEFFGWVQPIHFTVISDTLTIDIVKGAKIENDELGLGIGAFMIVCTKPFYNQTALKVSPLNFDTFKLDTEYQGDYQYVCDFFLEKAMQDNMQLLQGVGVQQIDRELITIQDLRERLENRYGSSLPVIVELDTTIDEC